MTPSYSFILAATVSAAYTYFCGAAGSGRRFSVPPRA
jgi:hypothetical protein